MAITSRRMPCEEQPLESGISNPKNTWTYSQRSERQQSRLFSKHSAVKELLRCLFLNSSLQNVSKSNYVLCVITHFVAKVQQPGKLVCWERHGIQIFIYSIRRNGQFWFSRENKSMRRKWQISHSLSSNMPQTPKVRPQKQREWKITERKFMWNEGQNNILRNKYLIMTRKYDL